MSCARCKDWGLQGLSDTCPDCNVAEETNSHIGSSFNDHFQEQFQDPKMARRLYDSTHEDLDKAVEEIKTLRRKLSIESAENARLHSFIKRKGL